MLLILIFDPRDQVVYVNLAFLGVQVAKSSPKAIFSEKLRMEPRAPMSRHPQNERLRLRIVGLDCVTCSLVIHRALEGVKGVRNVGVSYMMDLALVDYDPSVVSKEKIMNAVKKTGYDVVSVAM
jgi:copper chaperone CopZ